MHFPAVKLSNCGSNVLAECGCAAAAAAAARREEKGGGSSNFLVQFHTMCLQEHAFQK